MNNDMTAGIAASLRRLLIPATRSDELVDEIEGAQPSARKAAVLIPLFTHNSVTHLAFIRRASTLRTHSGEIAFPGGKCDPEDSSAVATALREANEELGLLPERVEVLGVLRPVFTVVSNFVITPVIGYLPEGLGILQLQPAEVAELLLVPLHELQNMANFHTEQWHSGGINRTVYFYDYGPYRIWGATGRILNALLELLPTK